MAAQPEESAQSADLQDPELEHKDRTATEMESNQGGDELPCPSHYTSWKECFHEKVQQRCLSLQETKVRLVQAQKAEEAKVRRREPGDWLAREWYNEEKETLGTRIYLLDNLLPTLIPGAENLLMEVERNHVLVSDQEPTRFNPINYLGEYLMRHNPQYSVPTKPGPYLREMKMVSEELKFLRQGTTSQRLAQMKAEAKNKREEREEVERQKAEETARRKEVVAALLKEWTVDGSDRIPAALVQSAMRSFPDVTDSIPEDMRKGKFPMCLPQFYCCDLNSDVNCEQTPNGFDNKESLRVDTSGYEPQIFRQIGKTLNHHVIHSYDLENEISRKKKNRSIVFDDNVLTNYTKLVHSYTEHVSSDKFQEIMEYLHKCAEDFQEATKHDTRRQIFIDLFHTCAYGKVGVLDRQKILALLRDFYDRRPMTDEFWNPREWPIIELQDIHLMDFWGSLGDQEVCEELSENLVLSQTEISEGEILGNEPVDDDTQGTDRMSTSATGGIVEEIGLSEAGTGEISKKKNEEAEPRGAEVSKEGEDAMTAVQSTGLEATDLDGDTIHREKSSSNEDTKTEREAEPGTADRQDEALPGSASAGNSLSTDGEPGSGKPEESILGGEPEIGDHTSAREPGSEGQVSQEDSGVTETAPEATGTASGDRAVTDTDVTDSQQDAPAAEAVKETPASNESQSDQQTSSETRLQGEDLLHDQSKDSGPSVAEIQNPQDSCTMRSFAASCLTLPQFVQLMDNFVGEHVSLPTVKRLTAFIKGEYKQTEEEKIKQLEKVNIDKFD
ncbi:hypothetical protein DUI87_12414 [Hirundo rustica rustica]|uniref:Uncharacterized protein n=1 Tax=Hirundo rustica rustica TaxID=333673 RepID=A0A3M0KBX8_HIRRU|nr:hypothetical protein DUI87_12414 [Hirundo rustica rustica]